MNYLLAFSAQEFIYFRELEVRSLLTINGLSQECLPGDTNWTTPYILITLPDDAAAATLIERSMLIKNVYSVWAFANTFDALLTTVCIRGCHYPIRV